MGICFSSDDDQGDNGNYSGNNEGYSGGENYSGGGNNGGYSGNNEGYSGGENYSGGGYNAANQNYALESEVIAMEGAAAAEASAGSVLT